jgi:predicted dehydrogenase
MVMRTAIVGCGLIGHKRAAALGAHPLVATADLNPGRATALAGKYSGCTACAAWQEAVARPDVDAVVVATTNDALAPVTLAAIQAGKHVIVEKPGARSAEELDPIVDAAHATGVVVKVGFNKRFHPAFLQARKIVDEGGIGPMLFLRARYGHGGRIGYDKEWRAVPEIAGGGELLDQGVHLIDLSRWFLGDFPEVRGQIATYFWDMPVEDNGFLSLTTGAGQTAWLHASCTEWKNLFSFELYGREGKLQVDGIGGSYGVERLSYYHMLPQMGPPETTIWEYPGEDLSWKREFEHFVECVEQGQRPSGSLEDARAVLAIVGEVYCQSRDTTQPQLRRVG